MKRVKRWIVLLSVAMATAQATETPEEVSYAPQPFVIGVQIPLQADATLLMKHLRDAENKGWGTMTQGTDPLGSPLVVFRFSSTSPFPNVAIVANVLNTGMENAAVHSVLLSQGLGSGGLIPNVVIQEGLTAPMAADAPNAMYVLNWHALGNTGILRDDGFTVSATESWNPSTKSFEKRIFFPADPRLVRLAGDAFREFKKTPEYSEFSKLPGKPLELNTEGFGISSNSIVLGKRLRATWKQQYETQLASFLKSLSTNGKTYPLSAIDRESAAASKVFFEHDIPFAAVRIPLRDSKDGEEKMEAAKALQVLGQEFLWQWILEIAANKSQFVSYNYPGQQQYHPTDTYYPTRTQEAQPMQEHPATAPSHQEASIPYEP